MGFRPKHRLEDLVLLVDLLVDRAKATKTALAMAFIDLEKAFDRIPRPDYLTYSYTTTTWTKT